MMSVHNRENYCRSSVIMRKTQVSVADDNVGFLLFLGKRKPRMTAIHKIVSLGARGLGNDKICLLG